MTDDPKKPIGVIPDEERRVRVASLLLRLRSLGISDRRVLNALEKVPRDLFVPEDLVDYAYDDRALPIECGQTISAPSVVAMMSVELNITDRHKVLEIGTGSGYQTAILALLGRRVTTLERFRLLIQGAQKRWEQLGLTNISVVQADGSHGWKRQAPFDRILVTAFRIF